MALRIDSGSGGGSTETQTTSTDDRRERIDLGHSASGGNNQRFDLGTNRAAAVDTSDDIKDAGGPGTVLAGTQNQVTEINKAVSDVSGQIRDRKEKNSAPEPEPEPKNQTTDVPTEVTAARNASNTVSPGQNGPVSDRDDGHQGVFGALFGVISSVLSALFGG